MITKTKAIVFKNFKYGEDSLICMCFTEEHGLLSFFLKGINKKSKSSIKKSQFELLNNLSVIYNYKPNSNFKFFKEVILFLGKNGKEILSEVLREWKFDYEEKKSITSKDSTIIKIKNLNKK